MRKSKMALVMGVVGGVPSDLAIVPPAAAMTAHAILPENSPILQRLLSDDEMAAIKQHRMRENPPRYRQHTHRNQVERDARRTDIDKSLQRRSREAKSAMPRHKEGTAFKLGRAQLLTPQEEAELLGSNISFPPLPSAEKLGVLEDTLNKSVNKELVEQIESAKPRNQKRLPKTPGGESGGVGLISNVLGPNPRSMVSKKKRSSSAPVKIEQPSLDGLDKSTPLNK